MEIDFATLRGCNKIVGLSDDGRIFVREFSSWKDVRRLIIKCWGDEQQADEYLFNHINTGLLDEATKQYVLKDIREISRDDLPEFHEVVYFNSERFVVGSGINKLKGWLCKNSK